jgi:predicted nucleic acid-binding protein
MTTLLLDSNIYDQLAADPANRTRLARIVATGNVRVIATPIVIDELRASPFGGLPPWFAVDTEPEHVAVYDYARYRMARYGDGQVYSEHRGSSNNIKDGIIADSANALADIFVSQDERCRRRFSRVSSNCKAKSYDEFC